MALVDTIFPNLGGGKVMFTLWSELQHYFVALVKLKTCSKVTYAKMSKGEIKTLVMCIEHNLGPVNQIANAQESAMKELYFLC